MPLHPPALGQRFASVMKDLQMRVTKLESRTASIDSGWPLAVLPAVVDAGYTTGDPQVYINGATALSGPYQYLSSYTPAAGDNVLVAPVGATRTYVVLGKLA